MDRLAGDGAGGGLPTAGEAAVDELVVDVLLLLTAAVDVEVVGTVEVDVDGLLLFRWMLDVTAVVLFASADGSPDTGPLPLTGSCCDGGGYFI